MKLMQNEFPMFRKIEVELTQEKDIEKIPDRPSRFLTLKMFFFISGNINHPRDLLIEMGINLKRIQMFPK